MKNLRLRRFAATGKPFLKASLFPIFFLAASASLYAQNCTINAGIDQTICANGTLTLTGIKNGTLQSGITTWSQVGGSAVAITSPNSLTTTVTGFGAGTYTFRLSTTCQDGSAINDDVVITVSPVTIANAGPAQTLCPGSGTLAANSPSPGTGNWSFIGTNNADIVVVSNGSPVSAITLPASSAGSSTLRWTIRQGSCISFSDVVITNRGGAGPVNAGPDQTLGNCYSSTTSATLTGSFVGNAGGQGGTWTTVSGPNTPVITAPASTTTTVSNLVQGVYVFRWTASGACLSGSDDVQITVPAPSATLTASNPGSAQIFCDGRSTVVLTGNNPGFAGETVQWTQTAGPSGATVSSPSSPSTTVTGLDGSSTYGFRYTITNTTSGCSSDSTITVGYNTAPSITVNGGVKTITLSCGTTTVSVPYTFSGGNATQYRIVSAPSGYGTLPAYWSTPTGPSPQPFYGISTAGTYVMRFMRTGGTGCAAAYDDVTVIVSKAPSLSRAGTYQTLACNVVSTSLAGNVPATGTGSWSQVGGPNTATIANPALNTSGISGLANGKYIFKWIVSAGSACPASEDTVSVVVASTTPTAANAGPDRTVCNGSPVTLSANSPVLNETGVWKVTPSAGISFSNTSSPTATVTGLQANTTYTFTWTISNACGTSSDDVVITANGTAGPVQATAGADQCLSSTTTTTTLSGNAASPAGASSLWSQLSGPSSATFTNSAGSSTSVSGLSNGTYQFLRTMSLSGCGNTMDTVVVTVSASATVANAGADQSLCVNTATLAANNPTTGTGMWTQVAGPGGVTVVSPMQNTSTLSGLVPGVYTFRWTISNGGCAGNYDDVAINVSTAPSGSDAGPDQNCLTGATATLAAISPASGTGLWSQVSGPSAAAITTATAVGTSVTGLVNGVYTFRWTVGGGPACAATTDDVLVSVAQPASGGGTVTLCNVTTTLLSGNAGSTGSWIQRSSSNGSTPTLTTLSGYMASVENMSPGTYVFRYTLTPAAGCASSSADRTVILSTPPSMAVAGANQSVCNATSFSLNATPPTTGTGAWDKVSGPANGSLATLNTAATSFTGAATGLYTFQWKVTNNGCSNSAQITVNNAAPASAADAGADQSFCGTTTTNLAAATPLSGNGSWTQTGGPSATILNPALASTSVSGLSSGTYTFRWTVSSGACAVTTDEMRVGVCAVLPLRLLLFEAEKKNGYASLLWKTANEEGVKSFIIERSSDGNGYTPLTETAAKNGAQNVYAYNDNLNAYAEGAVYYRLKMMNTDGSFSYSMVVRINLQKASGLLVTVAPNPVRTKASLQIESSKGGKAAIRVLDYAGKAVIVQEEVLAEGITGFVLRESDRLPNGIYVVTVQTKEGVHSQKLVVQR